MTVIEKVISEIQQIPALNGKVYYAEALKNAEVPFVFWQQNSGEILQALDGYTELKTDIYAIHVVTENISDLMSYSEAVKEKITGLQGISSGNLVLQRINLKQTSPDIKEKEVGLYRKVFVVAIDYIEQESAPDDN